MDSAQAIQQIEDSLAIWRVARSRSKYDNLSDLGDEVPMVISTRLAATIERLAPNGSRYRENAASILKSIGPSNSHNIRYLAGILQALKDDIAAGYLRSVEELIHADIFADFLEMAQHLLDEGYKDPAAVLTGGVLEEHLRKLATRSGIAIELNGRPKKADAINSELTAASVYSKLDQKSITAWLDLRNKAAHGKFNEYTKQQVELFVQGVRDFLARLPA